MVVYGHGLKMFKRLKTLEHLIVLAQMTPTLNMIKGKYLKMTRIFTCRKHPVFRTFMISPNRHCFVPEQICYRRTK